MESFKSIMHRGIIKENPTFVLFLGLCPTLATTNSFTNAIGMGTSVLIVLVLSNTIISLIKNFVPNNIRIPIYITVIATLVTLLQIVLSIFLPALYDSLGIYLPLIVVNCIVLGRAEAYASQNPVKQSLYDGLATGLGFLFALAIIGFFRELLGTGSVSLLHFSILGPDEAMAILVQPSGAFLIFGMLAWIANTVKSKKGVK